MTKLSDNKEVASSPLVGPIGTEDDRDRLGVLGGNPNG
jgi:hypothetical protein